MPTTDRRARLHCEDCGVALDDATAERNMLACWTYCDACLARLLAPLPEMARAQSTAAARGRRRAAALHNQALRRAERRARRLAIERQRRRMADHPRVGDRITDVWGETFTVVWVSDDRRIIAQSERHAFGTGIDSPDGWREEVRRARMAQDGPA